MIICYKMVPENLLAYLTLINISFFNEQRYVNSTEMVPECYRNVIEMLPRTYRISTCNLKYLNELTDLVPV